MELRNFLSLLQDKDQLRRIRVPVDPDLEAAALLRREFAAQGKAVLFERLRGYHTPLLANVFGSEERLALAFGCDSLGSFSLRLRSLLESAGQGSFSGRMKKLCTAASATFLGSAPQSQQVLAPNNLALLPALRSWPQEPLPSFNLPLVISRHPHSGQLNIGLYRATPVAADKLAINLPRNSGCGLHLAAAQVTGCALPVAIAFGCDPALIWLAAAPLPEDLTEWDLLEPLFSQSLQLAPALTQPLQVPAEAEYIVEGVIRPGDRAVEGPFGNHTGQYVQRKDCPLLTVSAITHRPDPLMLTTVIGPPPSENILLGRATCGLIREWLRVDVPEILDLRMPDLTLFHGAALLQVRSGSKDSRELIEKLWSDSPLQRAKLLVLFDEDIDLDAAADCFWRLVNQLDAARIVQSQGRTAIDATGVDQRLLVRESPETSDLLARRAQDYDA